MINNDHMSVGTHHSGAPSTLHKCELGRWLHINLHTVPHRPQFLARHSSIFVHTESARLDRPLKRVVSEAPLLRPNVAQCTTALGV